MFFWWLRCITRQYHKEVFGLSSVVSQNLPPNYFTVYQMYFLAKLPQIQIYCYCIVSLRDWCFCEVVTGTSRTPLLRRGSYQANETQTYILNAASIISSHGIQTPDGTIFSFDKQIYFLSGTCKLRIFDIIAWPRGVIPFEECICYLF